MDTGYETGESDSEDQELRSIATGGKEPSRTKTVINLNAVTIQRSSAKVESAKGKHLHVKMEPLQLAKLSFDDDGHLVNTKGEVVKNVVVTVSNAGQARAEIRNALK